MKIERPDKTGSHRAAYESNKKKILKTQCVCGICGKPVDKTLKAPHPMAPTIDHIIPVSKGGHPSAIENLQLAHATCNRNKSDKLFAYNTKKGDSSKGVTLSNRDLPHSIDWFRYKSKE